MKSLLIDTSSKLLFVSFYQDNNLLFNSIVPGNNNHSEHLINVIKEGMNKTQLQIKDFDRIIVGIGPGSYTGLRVGLTVCKMFSWTLNIPLYTISSLDLLVSGYINKDGRYLSMMVAKKDYSYTKKIIINNGKIEVLENERFIENNQINSDSFIKINEETYDYNPLLIYDELLTKVENIHSLEPNYLRGAM